RKVTPKDPVHILTWIRLPGEAKPLQKGGIFPVVQKKGRVRMERTGTEMKYYLAEGDDKEFKLLTTFPFVSDDVKSIQLFGETTSATAAVEVRFTDLHIAAKASLPKAAASIVQPIRSTPKSAPAAEPAPANPPKEDAPAKSSGALSPPMLVGLGILAVLG